MRTDLFDYPLPPGRIAQEPVPRRDRSRLMVVDRSTGSVSHGAFHDLPGLLEPGDCLVVNSSRVFPGRLEARKEKSGGAVELLLLERLEPGVWRALTKGAVLRPGVSLLLGDGGLRGEVLDGPSGGEAVIRFEAGGAGAGGKVDEIVFAHGKVPLPPYIREEIADSERYQTVYAEREISAAAPTAGLHFTDALMKETRARGIEIASLELAVGMDTFVPVREEMIEDHRIHSEWFSISSDCAGAANGARDRGARVIAVGTTVVRALESASGRDRRVHDHSGRTGLFIKPGYRFRAVDALITNFHFPRSTLLMLVCAFGGRELIMNAYREAIDEGYRFYSFGDAMMVV